MKKYLFSVIFLIILNTSVRAEGRLGVRFLPGISYSSVTTKDPNDKMRSIGSHFDFQVGLFGEKEMRENLCLSLGLLYASEQASVESSTPAIPVCEKHDLSYLNIPLTLKLYTEEIALDTTLSFELGAVAKVKLTDQLIEKAKDKTQLILKFNSIGCDFLFGACVDYQIGTTTSVFGGIMFQLGLINIINDQNKVPNLSETSVKNHFIAFNFGFRF